jgi:hypothetical protein
MRKIEKPQRILWFENLGFLAIIIMLWLDNLPALSYHLHPTKVRFDWTEGAVETILVLLVWLPVHVFTRRLLARLHYLESYPRICAWCRKIGRGEEWLSMEDYFSKELDIKTNHGICPDCSKKILADETKSRTRDA